MPTKEDCWEGAEAWKRLAALGLSLAFPAGEAAWLQAAHDAARTGASAGPGPELDEVAL